MPKNSPDRLFPDEMIEDAAYAVAATLLMLAVFVAWIVVGACKAMGLPSWGD